MMNDFLSDILKVVIVLDVLGVIAYFLLGLKTKSQSETVSATAQNANEPVDEGLFGPGFLNPAAAAIQSPPPAPVGRTSFWRRMSSRLSRRRRALKSVPGESLDLAMTRLRGVLNSYERGLTM